MLFQLSPPFYSWGTHSSENELDHMLVKSRARVEYFWLPINCFSQIYLTPKTSIYFWLRGLTAENLSCGRNLKEDSHIHEGVHGSVIYPSVAKTHLGFRVITLICKIPGLRSYLKCHRSSDVSRQTRFPVTRSPVPSLPGMLHVIQKSHHAPCPEFVIRKDGCHGYSSKNLEIIHTLHKRWKDLRDM